MCWATFWATFSQTHLVTMVVVYFWLLFENYESSANYWDTFFPQHKLCISFDKYGLGYILGESFTNSSVHHGLSRLLLFCRMHIIKRLP
jgi:hypothetical protein